MQKAAAIYRIEQNTTDIYKHTQHVTDHTERCRYMQRCIQIVGYIQKSTFTGISNIIQTYTELYSDTENVNKFRWCYVVWFVWLFSPLLVCCLFGGLFSYNKTVHRQANKQPEHKTRITTQNGKTTKRTYKHRQIITTQSHPTKQQTNDQPTKQRDQTE